MNYNEMIYNSTKTTIDNFGQPLGYAEIADIQYPMDSNKMTETGLVRYKRQNVISSTQITSINDQLEFIMLKPVPINYRIYWNRCWSKVASIDNTITGIYKMYANIEVVFPPVAPHTYSITIDNTTLDYKVGNTFNITCTCKDNDTIDTNATIKYSTNNDNATIDDTGKVTCVSEGTVVITATYNEAIASKTFNIVKADEYAIQCNDITLDMGSTYQLNPICIINGVQVSEPSITYTVLDSSIATCSESGLVEGATNGSTIITMVWEGIEKVINVVVNEVILNYEIVGANNIKQNTSSTFTLNHNKTGVIWYIEKFDSENIATIVSQDSTSCTVKALSSYDDEFFNLYACSQSVTDDDVQNGRYLIAQKEITTSRK